MQVKKKIFESHANHFRNFSAANLLLVSTGAVIRVTIIACFIDL